MKQFGDMAMGTFINMSAVVVGLACVYLLYRKLCYGKKAFLYTMLTVPVVFFNTYYLIDAVSPDEAGYIPAYGNMAALEVGSHIWQKASYSYRMTQMVFGTVCRVIRKIHPLIEENTVNIIYKLSHWFFFFILALVIAYIWGKCIIEPERETLVYRMTNLGILYCLIGLPVSCLIMKMSNYDASHAYFSILAFSLIIASEKKNSVKLACFGAVLATFGCMEKWTTLIFYIIAVSMAVYLKIKSSSEKKRYLQAFLLIPSLMICSAVICILSFFYIRLLSGHITTDIYIGAMLFPMFYMVRVFAGQGKIALSDLSYYDHDFIYYLLLEMVLIVVAAALFFLLDFINQKIKIKQYSFLSLLTTAMGLGLTVSGIAGAFFLKRYGYPYIEYPEGIYQPGTLFNGMTYFYGAKTLIGHTVMNIIFANAVVITALPTSALIFLIAALFLQIRRKQNSFFLHSLFIIAFLLIPVFTLAGMPAHPRYFGVSILLMMLCSVYCVASYCQEPAVQERTRLAAGKALVICAMAAYTIEMLMNLPVYHCFSPAWLVRSKAFRETVRQGEWDAAEAMTVGEEMPLAGRMIQKHVEERGIEPEQVTIVTNYCTGWYTNPGFQIKAYANWLSQEDRVCDSDTYFIFAKVMLFRSEIPEFIKDVEPLYKVKIKGETTAWIYNGDQLAGYFAE